MKKILSILIVAVALISCSKEQLKSVEPETPTEQYFSHVRYFKDNRTPAIDTIWTLQMLNAEMVAQYAPDHGRIFNETSTHTEVGVLWSK